MNLWAVPVCCYGIQLTPCGHFNCRRKTVLDVVLCERSASLSHIVCSQSINTHIIFTMPIFTLLQPKWTWATKMATKMIKSWWAFVQRSFWSCLQMFLQRAGFRVSPSKLWIDLSVCHDNQLPITKALQPRKAIKTVEIKSRAPKGLIYIFVKTWPIRYDARHFMMC